MSDPNDPARYTVIVTATADGEARDLHQALRARVFGSYADRWFEALLRAIESLAYLPHQHPIARESYLSEIEIRRMLYHGPSRRRSSGTTYRIIFHIAETVEGERVVRVLHVWHGAAGRRSP